MIVGLKAVGIWILMALAAVINGALRDILLSKRIGGRLSLPLSGLSLSAANFLIVYFTFNWFQTNQMGREATVYSLD